jgi:hypothetical protein
MIDGKQLSLKQLISQVDISQLNHRLNMMSQMPNNNIGLALIFKRFSQMSEEEQKQYVSLTLVANHFSVLQYFQ